MTNARCFPPNRKAIARRSRSWRAISSDADWFGGEGMTIANIVLHIYTHVAGEGGFALDAYPAVGAWLDRVAVEPGHVPMDLSGSSLGRTGLKEAAAAVRRRKEG